MRGDGAHSDERGSKTRWCLENGYEHVYLELPASAGSIGGDHEEDADQEACWDCE
jgi:hypothetical protein